MALTEEEKFKCKYYLGYGSRFDYEFEDKIATASASEYASAKLQELIEKAETTEAELDEAHSHYVAASTGDTTLQGLQETALLRSEGNRFVNAMAKLIDVENNGVVFGQALSRDNKMKVA